MVYSAGSLIVWGEMEGGELPSPRESPKATVVRVVLYVSGGFDGVNCLISVLLWDPVVETWQEVGNLFRKRDYHDAMAVPAAFKIGTAKSIRGFLSLLCLVFLYKSLT